MVTPAGGSVTEAEGAGSLAVRLWTLFLYCLPAVIALALILAGYKLRTDGVQETIAFHIELSSASKGSASKEGAPTAAGGDSASLELLLEKSPYFARLHETMDLRRALVGAMGEGAADEIDVKALVDGIWFRNAVIVALLVLLPYYILGRHLAGATHLPLTPAARRGITHRSWWVKFLVALVMGTGWLYVVNPIGRGATTVVEFLASIDIGKTDTLPLFIEPTAALPAVTAGFLGWYLHLLSYFFVKLSQDDVVSARVYGFLFRKFLFVYGISLLLSAVPLATEGQLAVFVFFIGYFPLSAISLIKEAGVKAAQGMKPEPGALSELPGIGRMQIIRLEEEGVDNISSLAYANLDELKRNIPAMASLVDFWVDVAQLYTIMGNERFAKLAGLCTSASYFLDKAGDPAFVEAVRKREAGEPEEILALLRRTFGERLHSSGAPAALPGASASG